MMEKIILDLCGGTGSWSKPYSENGYKVYVITLPRYDVFDITMREREREIIIKDFQGNEESIFAPDIYGILAAPTCTMFSFARTTAKLPRDFSEGMNLVRKCMEIIWFCRSCPGSNLKFWALENPKGYLRQFLGVPSYTFSPEEFGENYTKKTDLWGFFNPPRKSPRRLTDEERQRNKTNNRVLPKLPEGYVMPRNWTKQAARRSMTSKLFAEAFYKANK